MIREFRTACVTGGAGFIGSHLVRALLGRGMAVKVLDNLSVGQRGNVPGGALLIEGDILDPAAVREAFADCDAVFHLAARVAIRSSFEFVFEDTLTNAAGTAGVLRGAHEARSVRRVVSTSSMAVYADAAGPFPIDENHPTAPLSPYGVSKLASEGLVHTYCRHYGMESAVLRLFNTYGPGQTLSPYVGVVTIFVNCLREGKAPTIYGDGEQRRDFVHVEDVARGFVGAMEARATGETFNIGTGIATSVNTVLGHLQRVMGTAIEPVHAEAVPGELRYSVADIAKARRMLGYAPGRRYEDSIDAVVREILASA